MRPATGRRWCGSNGRLRVIHSSTTTVRELTNTVPVTRRVTRTPQDGRRTSCRGSPILDRPGRGDDARVNGRCGPVGGLLGRPGPPLAVADPGDRPQQLWREGDVEERAEEGVQPHSVVAER